MKKIIIFTFVIFLDQAFGASNDSQSRAVWSKKMQTLANILPELIPDITFYSRYNDPKNYSRIEKNVKQLSEMAHKINLTKVPGEVLENDADPTIAYMADLFESQVNNAYAALKSGNREYARRQLMGLTNYCIGCHSRGKFGLEFENLPFDKKLGPMLDLDRADLFAATRQFDKALDTYEKIGADTTLRRDRALDWEKAIRKGLLIAVRYKQDPDRALKILDEVLQSPTAPTYFKEDALEWKKTVLAWKKEPKRKKQTSAGYLAEAQLLIAEGRKVQKYPVDHSGDIYFMRASATLHEFLKEKHEKKDVTEALFLLGICYEALDTVAPYGFHEVFYESCVHNLPNSDIAKKCFRRYEQSVNLGYTGSGGFQLPRNVKAHLVELEAKAGFETKPK